MSYCRNLGFEETPNYAYLRRLFKELYNKCCFEYDFIFDWTIQRYRLEVPIQYAGQEEQKVDGKSTLPDSMKGNGGAGSDEIVLENNKGEWAQSNQARFENEESKVVELRLPKMVESNSVLEQSQKSSKAAPDQQQQQQQQKKDGGCSLF